MVQKEVSINCVIAWVGWVLAAVVSAVGLLYHLHIAGLAVMLSAGAGTLHIRGFIRDLERREREAFQLGRDSVRPLR